jgi:pimeloyl-ACP methyl ester carboxylesterase
MVPELPWVRLYASTYPKDVSGLVLVDALSEGLQDAETPQQWAIQRKLIQGDDPESLALYPALERIDVHRSCDQMRAAPALHPMPIVVLSADRPWGPQVQSIIHKEQPQLVIDAIREVVEAVHGGRRQLPR